MYKMVRLIPVMIFSFSYLSAQVTGTILNDSGSPVSGCTVTLGDTSDTSDNSGGFSITGTTGTIRNNPLPEHTFGMLDGKLNVDLKTAARIGINVYDAGGTKTSSGVKQKVSKGRHSFSISDRLTEDNAPGLYLIRLQIDDVNHTLSFLFTGKEIIISTSNSAFSNAPLARRAADENDILEIQCGGIFQKSIAVEAGSQELGNITVYGKPNMIFLLTDDQAYWAAGFNGNTEILTPYMDQLSDEGVTFDRHYNTTAICMASRATILAGQYEYKTGVNFSGASLMPAEDYAQTYSMLLKDAGYYVGFAGKHGFDSPAANPDTMPTAAYEILPGDHYDWWKGGPGQTSYVTANNHYLASYAGDYPHSSRAYGAAGADFIAEAKASGKPFNLSISFKAPHNPMTPDTIFNSLFQGKTWSRPENYGPEKGTHLAEQYKQGRQFKSLSEWWLEDVFDQKMSDYYQLIYGVDSALGMIRTALKEQGVEDNTVIMLTGDNGYFAGNFGLGGKCLPYEPSSRAPMIVYDPRRASSGQKYRVESVTGNVDVAPTILELAGVAIPAEMDGHSLNPLLDNPGDKVRDWMPLFQTYGVRATTVMSIIHDTWKYIYWHYGEDGMVPTEELFNVRTDPLEMDNAAGDAENAAILEMMRGYHAEQIAYWKNTDASYGNYDRWADIFARP